MANGPSAELRTQESNNRNVPRQNVGIGLLHFQKKVSIKTVEFD